MIEIIDARNIITSDDNITLQRNASPNYLLAKQLVLDTTLTPSNSNILLINNYLNDGLYDDLGNRESNYDKYITRTNEIFRKNKIKLSSLDNIRSIVNKLYYSIPIVPTGELIQDLMQDIQNGRFKDCGDPNKNFDLWKNKAIELLKQRGIIDKGLDFHRLIKND